MLKSSKKLICLLLLLSIVLGGCGVKVNLSLDNKSNNKSVEYKPTGREIYAPVEIPYAIDNPIEIINVRVLNNTDHQQSYFQINGLKDKDVEDKINNDIKSLFEKMLPYVTREKLPPYRGIEAGMDGDIRLNYSTLSVIPQFNCNNVLSVVAYVSAAYYNPRNRHSYFSATEALNFDLNTGNTFLIEDVFTNGTDGLEIVNKAIVDDLTRRRLSSHIDYDDFSDLTLVAPFKGINSDQKFYLTHDGIKIVIDYENPEFDVGFSYTIVNLPFHSKEGHIAITERFYDENKSIFNNDIVGKRFLPNFFLGNISETKFYTKDDIDWYVNIGSSQNIPEIFKDIMNSLKVEQEQMIALMSKEWPVSYVSQDIYTHTMGPFVNVRSHLHAGHEDSGLWQEFNYVYSEIGEPIGIGDVFAEGYDYLALINKAFQEENKRHSQTRPFEGEITLDQLMFTINDDRISFVTKVQEWTPDSGQIYFNISYEEIGYKNLRIFD